MPSRPFVFVSATFAVCVLLVVGWEPAPVYRSRLGTPHCQAALAIKFGTAPTCGLAVVSAESTFEACYPPRWRRQALEEFMMRAGSAAVRANVASYLDELTSL